MDKKITALTQQKRNRQRVNVYLDGEFAFGLARITAAWLEVGQVISEEKIRQLLAEDEREVAYQRALRFLSYRMRSSSEVRKHLQKLGVAEQLIDETIERLHKAGFIDDARFAETWVENRSDLRPRSQRALRYELRQRGIDDQTIQQTLEQVDDEELAVQAALKQSRKYQNLEWQDFRLKMYGFLARRGFAYEACREATARAWSELHNHSHGNDQSIEEVYP